VLWLDLDSFKVVNDSLGHQLGDTLLVRVSERIRGQLRATDTAARFGGDEFAVLVSHAPDVATVEAVARRLLDCLSRPYDVKGREIVVTASAGVAMSAIGYERAEDVLRDADVAMYEAKSQGRGGLTVFDPSMHARAVARLETETELRQAIEPRGDGAAHLELHYQPIVDLASAETVGLEALVRWRHPQRGLLAPGQFLQVAEDSGLMVPLGRWVVSEACRQVAAWVAGGAIGPSIKVSVNLSNREFWGPKLFEHLDAVVKGNGVSPERFAIEITEGVIIDNLERALVLLHELRARGFEVHMDDFGTGYSSLHALHRLPIDALKVDKSFVAGLGEDKRRAELVYSITQLGNNLGVRVIAEGVETQAQRQRLRELGCAFGQGYLFSRPVAASQVEHFIAPGAAAPPTHRPG
jgi:diguanylate cyclase (GGDEF)-like protein